jgi:hypothetical protein
MVNLVMLFPNGSSHSISHHHVLQRLRATTILLLMLSLDHTDTVCSIFLPFVGSLSCPGFDLFILLYARLTNAGPKLCDCRADRKPCRGWAGYWRPVSTARGAVHQRGRAGRVVGQIFSHFSIFI